MGNRSMSWRHPLKMAATRTAVHSASSMAAIGKTVQFTLALILGLLVGVPKASAMTEPEPGLLGKTIVVDAGHGGPDTGARGAGGTYEKDINLAVARKLAALLSEAGARVVMTRSIDKDLATERDRAMRHRHLGDLRGRFEVVKQAKPDAFISVHCNAVTNPKWRGAHVIYMAGNDQGKQLATGVQSAFKQFLLPTNRTVDDTRSLYLLKRIPGPTVLAEVGFVSNPAEESYLRQSSYQERIAFAISTATIEYFGATSDSGTPESRKA